MTPDTVYDFVAGDTTSVLERQCKDSDGNVIDLTSATVYVKFVTRDSRGRLGTRFSKTATITDAANGWIQYQFEAGELQAGTLFVDITIEIAGRDATNLEQLEFKVRARNV